MENYNYIDKEVIALKENIKEVENYLKESPFLKEKEEVVKNINNLKNLLTNRINTLIKSKIEIEKFISNLDEPNEIKFLRLRCYEGFSYEHISEKMGLSLKTLFRYRKNIIKKLSSIK